MLALWQHWFFSITFLYSFFFTHSVLLYKKDAEQDNAVYILILYVYLI